MTRKYRTAAGHAYSALWLCQSAWACFISRCVAPECLVQPRWAGMQLWNRSIAATICSSTRFSVCKSADMCCGVLRSALCCTARAVPC
jgi:hypothetical protein